MTFYFTYTHNYRFSDASHFSRIHTEFYGVTPSFIRSNNESAIPDIQTNTKLNHIEKQMLTGQIFIIN